MSQSTNKTNFFIVGSPRTGTTALHDQLQQHPEICMSNPKEPSFFCTDFHEESDRFHNDKKYFPYRTLEKYHSIFNPQGNETIFGESSTSYLSSAVAAQSIFEYNQLAKILIVLRDPVEVIFSLFNRLKALGVEPVSSFEKALELETQRKKGDIPKSVVYPSSLFYRERISFAKQIHSYLDVFPHSQIKIILYDNLVNQNQKTVEEIYDFLCVSIHPTPDLEKTNATLSVRNQSIQVLLNKARNSKPAYLLVKLIPGVRKISAFLFSLNTSKDKPEKLSKSTESLLKTEFTPAVQELGKMLNLDLMSMWNYK